MWISRARWHGDDRGAGKSSRKIDLIVKAKYLVSCWNIIGSGWAKGSFGIHFDRVIKTDKEEEGKLLIAEIMDKKEKAIARNG